MSSRYAETSRIMDFPGLVDEYLATPCTTAEEAARCFATNLAAMRPKTQITVGLEYSDTWRPMKTTGSSCLGKTHRDVAYGVEFLVTKVFHATGVVAARFGKAVSSFKTAPSHSRDASRHDWQSQNDLQLLLARKYGTERSASETDTDPTFRVAYTTAPGRTSAVDPAQLSRIDESNEEDEAPNWFTADVWLTCSPKQKAFQKGAGEDSNSDTEHRKPTKVERQGGEMKSASVDLAPVRSQNRPKSKTPAITRAEIIAITWPKRDAHGNTYASARSPGDTAKLITMRLVLAKREVESRSCFKTSISGIVLEVAEDLNGNG